MIGKINNFVSKVVDTMKGPLHSWGTKPAVKKTSVVSKKVSKRKVSRKSRRN
jgi:hypothetical protein